MEEVFILSAARSPLARARKGSFRSMRIDDIAAQVMKGALVRIPGLVSSDIEQVFIGCAHPEGEQGLNIARNIGLLAGLPVAVSGATISSCSLSSFDAFAHAVAAITSGSGDLFVVGGVESPSHVPKGGFNPSYNARLVGENSSDAYITMGMSAENIARHYAITRNDQDEYAFSSHMKACSAMTKGMFGNELVPIEALMDDASSITVTRDELPNANVTRESLITHPPAYLEDGTVTGGNSALSADGAAFCVLASKRFAKRIKAKPISKIVGILKSGIDPASSGAAPIHAVTKLTACSKMKLKNIDLFEIDEPHAANAIAAIRELGIDDRRVNINGGAIALGQALGATGVRLVTTLVYSMHSHSAKSGLVAMSGSGGQGAAILLQGC